MMAGCLSDCERLVQSHLPDNAIIMFLGWEVVHVDGRGVLQLRARFLAPDETFCFVLIREVYIGCQVDFASSGVLQEYLKSEHEVWRGYFYIRGGIRPV